MKKSDIAERRFAFEIWRNKGRLFLDVWRKVYGDRNY